MSARIPATHKLQIGQDLANGHTAFSWREWVWSKGGKKPFTGVAELRDLGVFNHEKLHGTAGEAPFCSFVRPV